MRTYLVYMHITPKGKRYIGITCKSPERRWRNGSGYKRHPMFYAAIQKYGWDNIVHEIVAENLTERAAKAMEVELISKYKTQNSRYGYNCTAGGDGLFGYIPSEETKTKLSKINKGKRLDDKHKAKISETLKGRQKSEETIAKLSAANMGKRPTAEHRAKLSEAQKGNKCALGHKLTEEQKAKISAANTPLRNVYQYSLDGELVKVWDSLSSATNKFKPGKKLTSISLCVTGRRPRAYGYMWSYEPLQGEVSA